MKIIIKKSGFRYLFLLIVILCPCLKLHAGKVKPLSELCLKVFADNMIEHGDNYSMEYINKLDIDLKSTYCNKSIIQYVLHKKRDHGQNLFTKILQNIPSESDFLECENGSECKKKWRNGTVYSPDGNRIAQIFYNTQESKIEHFHSFDYGFDSLSCSQACMLYKFCNNVGVLRGSGKEIFATLPKPIQLIAEKIHK